MITREEALKMLEIAPKSELIKSKVNPSFTQFQAHDLIYRCVEKYPDGGKITGIMETRVHQICKNQRRPRL
jgi:hypothetical protein